MTTVFFQPPPDFDPQVTVAGCYCEFENTILFLKRHPKKLQGETWGIPGGKVDLGETPIAGVIREVDEEVGIKIAEDELEMMDEMYVRGSEVDYIFYRFRKRFVVRPIIHLCLVEHTEARWVTFEEALKLPLIYGGTEALMSYRDHVKKSQ